LRSGRVLQPEARLDYIMDDSQARWPDGNLAFFAKL